MTERKKPRATRLSPWWRRAVLIAALPGAACATDQLALAPAAPGRPLLIPPSLSAPPPPDAANVLSSHILSSHNGGADFPPGNAVAIDPAKRYDLAALIDLAERNNPVTREAWESARQAALAVGLSETSFLPQISAEMIGGFQRTPLPIPTTLIPQGYFTSDTRELIPTLAVKWLLFDFGQRAGATEAARASSFVANVAFSGAQQRLVYAVSRDYFALGAARGRLRVAREALKTAEIVEDAAVAALANGLGTVVALAEARRQTAEARFDLERATADEHSAYEALIASMGIAPEAHIHVADSTQERLPAAPSADVDRFIHEALSERPDVNAAIGQVRAAEATLKSARASYYPTIGLEAQAYQNFGGLSTDGSSYYSVDKPGANVILKLSLPLFDGGARSARVATARSEVAAAGAVLEQARNAAVQQVSDAYDALRTSFAEYAASVALTAAAETAYDAALDAYRNGVGTYTDLVRDETALAEAQSEKEDAHANVFTSAAALAFATGSILSPQSRTP